MKQASNTFQPLRAETPEQLEEHMLNSFKTNVVGIVHLYNLFLPLIKKGNAKKVIAISSGHADIDLVTEYDLDVSPPYAISKIGLNLAVAKFSAEYKSEGILFMSISPGVVDTSQQDMSQCRSRIYRSISGTLY